MSAQSIDGQEDKNSPIVLNTGCDSPHIPKDSGQHEQKLDRGRRQMRKNRFKMIAGRYLSCG